MSELTADYAFLSDLAYNVPRLHVGDSTAAAPSGVKYKIVDAIDDSESGYSGYVFLSEDGNNLIVAHTGTEFDTDPIPDLISDVQMGVTLNNRQIFAARDLVERALQYSTDYPTHPPVSITGHSLGGALTQITAYEKGLYGETFNAYGAAGLYGVPSGGTSVKNYIRATDAVAALGDHFGEVIAYATEQDVETLVQGKVTSVNPFPFQDLLDHVSLGPSVTHGIDQFWGENSILTEENRSRYLED